MSPFEIGILGRVHYDQNCTFLSLPLDSNIFPHSGDVFGGPNSVRMPAGALTSTLPELKWHSMVETPRCVVNSESLIMAVRHVLLDFGHLDVYLLNYNERQKHVYKHPSRNTQVNPSLPVRSRDLMYVVYKDCNISCKH